MAKKKNFVVWQGLVIALAVVLAVLGGGYYYSSHAVESQVPGNMYSYTSISKEKTIFVAFSPTTNRAVVDTDQSVVAKAHASREDFNKAYVKQAKAKHAWQYKTEGNTVTLAQISGDTVSQWQYNGILATPNHLYARGFSYQISKAGQGKVNKWVTFTKIN